MEKQVKQKKAILWSFIVFTLLLSASMILLTQQGDAVAAELFSWCLIFALLALAVFVFCALRFIVSKTTVSSVRQKSGASLPGRVELSEEKLSELLKLFGDSHGASAAERHMIADIAMNGDCQPAVVMDTSPFLVAAYSEDMDCVAMLRFPDALLDSYALVEGSRLVTANMYQTGRKYVSDLIQPEGRTGFSNMQSVVLDFISDDTAQIAAREAAIPAQAWERATQLGINYLVQKPGVYRSGDPRFTFRPGIDRQTER